LEVAVAYNADLIVAKQIVTGQYNLVIVTRKGPFEVPWERCSPKLANASQFERSRAVLSPSGYGIHWPLLDEDLSVAELIL
jgi:hypothetical protein